MSAPEKRTKLLIVAWGPSIHAERRIKCFADDESFDVRVVSNYPFEIPNARLVNLRSSERMHVGKLRMACRLSSALTHLFFNAYALRNAARILNVGHAMGSPIRSIKKIFSSFGGVKGVLREVARMAYDLRAIERAVEDFTPDVILLQTMMYPCYLALLLETKAKLAVTFWNGDVLWWAKRTGLERLVKKRITEYGIGRMDAITVNSKAAYDACLSYGKPKDMIHLIRYPAVDMTFFSPMSKVESRRRLGITSSKVVLAPRGLGGYLNSETIVRSAAKVIERAPDTLFLFLASDHSVEELEKHKALSRMLGIEGKFRWSGHVNWEDMPVYYSCADVMVSISSNDSLPNCMLESMACGTPVIMGDIPQLREWIGDGKNGLFVPVYDEDAISSAILKVFENKDGFADQLVRNSIEHVKKEADSVVNVRRVRELMHKLGE